MSDCWVQMPLSALGFALQLASAELERERDDAPLQFVLAEPGPPDMPDLEELTAEFTRRNPITHPALAA